MENRTECPSYLFFNIRNGDEFAYYEDVFVKAMDVYTREYVSGDTTTVEHIQGHSFYLPVRKQQTVAGYGVLGYKGSHCEGESKWVTNEGQNGAPLYRFDYQAYCDGEYTEASVELTKEHMNVTVRFLDFDSFVGAGGIFPFYIVIRGGTRGIDAMSGIPVRGSFLYQPEEETAGLFRFTVPRQGDHALFMDLYAKDGAYIEEGLIHTFDLWDLLRRKDDFSWEMKNLPDVYIELNYRESGIRIQLTDWDGSYETIIES